MDELVKQVIKANRNVIILAATAIVVSVYHHKKIRALERKVARLERIEADD